MAINFEYIKSRLIDPSNRDAFSIYETKWFHDHEFRFLPAREDSIESINRFVLKGCPPEDFIYAILSNDLSKSFATAGSDNIQRIFATVCYVHNYIPANCHGSSLAVEAWIKKVKEANKKNAYV